MRLSFLNLQPPCYLKRQWAKDDFKERKKRSCINYGLFYRKKPERVQTSKPRVNAIIIITYCYKSDRKPTILGGIDLDI